MNSSEVFLPRANGRSVFNLYGGIAGPFFDRAMISGLSFILKRGWFAVEKAIQTPRQAIAEKPVAVAAEKFPHGIDEGWIPLGIGQK